MEHKYWESQGTNDASVRWSLLLMSEAIFIKCHSPDSLNISSTRTPTTDVAGWRNVLETFTL